MKSNDFVQIGFEAFFANKNEHFFDMIFKQI